MPFTPSLYAQLLGPRFDLLPLSLRAIHDERARKQYAGRCEVDRGRSWAARLVGYVASLPKESEDVPITVTIDCSEAGEIWTRTFGVHRMRSVIRIRQRALEERLGPITLAFDLDAQEDQIAWRLKQARFLFLPLPLSWFAGCTATETIVDGRYRFDVRAHMVGIGFLVHYRGWLVDGGA